MTVWCKHFYYVLRKVKYSTSQSTANRQVSEPCPLLLRLHHTLRDLTVLGVICAAESRLTQRGLSRDHYKKWLDTSGQIFLARLESEWWRQRQDAESNFECLCVELLLQYASCTQMSVIDPLLYFITPRGAQPLFHRTRTNLPPSRRRHKMCECDCYQDFLLQVNAYLSKLFVCDVTKTVIFPSVHKLQGNCQ